MRGYDEQYGGYYNRHGWGRSGMGEPRRQHEYRRPWAEGERPEHQGGSGGYRTGGRPAEYGRGDWWMANRGEGRQRNPYDAPFHEFSQRSRPANSPIGGMYPPVGGRQSAPRGLRYDRWFSDQTRWF